MFLKKNRIIIIDIQTKEIILTITVASAWNIILLIKAGGPYSGENKLYLYKNTKIVTR